MRDLEAAVSYGQRHRRKFALHYIDLDGFKDVNDRAGHPVGDLALQEAARRLRDVARRHDIPARIGGDEFVLLQTEVQDRQETAALGTRIVDALSAPYALDERTFELGASVGIAIYPYDGKEARELLKGADAALYRAKALGKHRVEVAAG
jgi:diguanylate cyclase (GGDEF)-like protein